MAERNVLVRLLANITDFKSQMDQAQRSVKGVGDKTEATAKQADTAFGRMAQSAQKNEKAWNTAGTALTAFGAAGVVALGASVRAAINWESAWAGVTKTVNGTDAELAKLESGLRGLARTLPATHGEIAAVAEAAGQLGVATKDVVSFTRTMVALGETTNLTADEAATSIAQMANVMRTAPEDVGRLGATLVALGNAGASTERDIIQMSQRISGAAAVVGMSEADVLAFANAVASMGIEVESGGTSVSRVLTDMSKAAQTGGAKLQVFARTAGVSAADFSRAFKEDPAEAFATFIEGLGGIQEAGGNVFAVLDDLGLSDVRVSQALLGMASSGDLLRESLDLGSEAWEENTALVEEAAKRYDTTASKLEIARNNINDAAIEIGEVFLPVLASLAENVASVAGWFADLPDPIQAAVGGLGAVASVGALAAGGFLLLFPRVIETYKAFQTLSAASPAAAGALGKLGVAAKVAVGMAALGIAVRALDEAMAPTPLTMEETTRALLDMDGAIGSLDAKFDQLDANLIGADLDSFGDAVRRLADPGAVDRLNDFGGTLFNVVSLGMSDTGGGAASRRRSLEAIQSLDGALTLMVQNGNAELAAEQFKVMTAAAKEQGVTTEELKELFPEYEAALKGIENESRLAAEGSQMQAESAAILAQNLEATYGSIEGYAAALGLSEDATADLIEQTSLLGESLASFIDPLGVYTGLLDEKRAAEEETARSTADATDSATDSWEDYVGDVSLSLDEYMAKLEEQLTAQQDWQVNMLILAGRVSEGTVAELAAMGVEGADLVAKLVNASDEELARFDEIARARSKEATDAWGAQLTMAAPVLAEIGRTAGAGVVEELAAQLAAGTTTVARIAAEYGIELAGGINPILTSLGKRPIAGVGGRLGGITQADGGLVDYYADGGENHTAQIAPAGAWRVWAEPETGGEAYIPLSPAKRTRSVDIWRQVGDRLGVQFQEFAFGGISDVPRPRSTAPYQPPISTAGDATMQKAYDEITAWLAANVETIQGGTPGSGTAGGGGWTSIFNYVKARVPQARVNSAFRPGDPGRHGLGLAVDFGFGTGPGGAGSAGLALINRVLYDGIGSTLRELIYDGIGDDRPDLYMGKAHTYSRATQLQHANHVHAAFAKGGILNPHVRDAGGPLLPGYTFNGTGGVEDVIPRHLTDMGGRYTSGVASRTQNNNVAVTANFNERDIARVVRQVLHERDALAPAWP